MEDMFDPEDVADIEAAFDVIEEDESTLLAIRFSWKLGGAKELAKINKMADSGDWKAIMVLTSLGSFIAQSVAEVLSRYEEGEWQGEFG